MNLHTSAAFTQGTFRKDGIAEKRKGANFAVRALPFVETDSATTESVENRYLCDWMSVATESMSLLPRKIKRKGRNQRLQPFITD
jgi:hypothetical protein